MGKKIIGVIAFAAIAVAAGWNYQQNKQEVELSDLALANIEALARDESGGGIDCCSSCSGAYCGIFIDTAGEGTKVYRK